MDDVEALPPHARRARLQRRRPRHPASAHDRRDRPRAPDQEPSRRVARIHPRRGADAAAREPDQAARRQGAPPGSDDRGARLVLPLGSRRLCGRDRGDPRPPLHEAGPASARLVGRPLPSRPPGWPGAARTCTCTGCRTPSPGPSSASVSPSSASRSSRSSRRDGEKRTISRPGRSRRVHRPPRRRSACGRASRAGRSG